MNDEALAGGKALEEERPERLRTWTVAVSHDVTGGASVNRHRRVQRTWHARAPTTREPDRLRDSHA